MKDIVRALKRCRKTTDFYRVQIALENCLSPSEIAELAGYRARLPDAARDWLDVLTGMLFADGAAPRPYASLRLTDHVWFFGHGPEEAPRPHLLLAFCGAAHRLMVPVSVVLQHIDTMQFDVVVLADPTRSAYLGGIDGFAPDFDGILDRVAIDIGLDGYRSVRCMGTSNGGAPALLAGYRIGAERAIALGGRPFRSREATLTDDEKTRRLFGEPTRQAGSLKTKTVCAHGGANDGDRDGARALVSIAGGEALSVPGIASHNLLFEVLKMGRLGHFLDHLLLGQSPGSAFAP